MDLLRPDWDAPAAVQALSTTRLGGLSAGPYQSLNLAQHVGDDEAAVRANRARLYRQAGVPAEPVWLNQVHGRAVSLIDAGVVGRPDADAAVAFQHGSVCAVMTADCLPVLLCDRAGSVVAAAHAGWRGLAAGVIDATVARMQRPAQQLMAWLGPSIGRDAFEVGDEVRAAFCAAAADSAQAFRPSPNGRWLADLPLLARQRLEALGVSHVSGGDRCTFTEEETFFSYRRDRVTGRMASLIWLQPHCVPDRASSRESRA
jgi:hypothetical protein